MAIRKKKILIVDSSLTTLTLMSEFLQGEGHETRCVNDVFGCLDTLVEMTPDIIFVDLIMPKIGGDDLCRIIRNMDQLHNCYLVILSGIAIEQHLDYRQLGVDALIAKGPFAEMRRHITQVIIDSEKPRDHIIIPELKGAEHLRGRQVTRELLNNNQHLKIILESMSQGIIELSEDRVAYVNPRAVLFLGVAREKLLGRRIADALPQPLLEAMATARTGQQPVSSTLQLGSYQVELEQFAIRSNRPSTIIMLSDITEQRQMEAVIEAANLTKNLGYVFSGIRHEIGNPVNSIKMALSVLQRNLAEYDRDTIALFLDRSLQEVTRLEYLLKALKNYSLFERPVMQELSVTEFISNFATLIRTDFESQHIKVHTILPSDQLIVLADSRALHHVMLNLITNAADALNGNQRAQIIVSAAKSNGQVNIKVDDNGKGISEADLHNLFKPFFTSKATGTGLGLVIVKKMLLAMNGRIGIESYQGMGTTVTISFPGAASP